MNVKTDQGDLALLVLFQKLRVPPTRPTESSVAVT